MKMNMDYCRFNNTRMALDECIESMENNEVSSYSELDEAERMLNNMLDFLMDNDIVEDFDNESLELVIDEMRKTLEEDQ